MIGRLIVVGSVCLNLCACGGCERGGYSSETGPVVVKTPESKDAEEQGGPAYLEAYEQAVNEISIDNARDKLEELNREIDEDAP